MDPQCKMKSLFPESQKGKLPIMLHGKMIQSRPQGMYGRFWRVHRKNVAIFHIAKAAHLIALVQISSASVERIFSQMKQI
jgi:hypothetical protein